MFVSQILIHCLHQRLGTIDRHRSNLRVKRVARGQLVGPGERPYQVWIGFPAQLGIPRCTGGSIIHVDWVLTAGHVVTDYGHHFNNDLRWDVMELRAGSNDVNSADMQRRLVLRQFIFPHPEFVHISRSYPYGAGNYS